MKMEEIKNLIIRQHEFEIKLSKLIDDARLPAFAIKPILAHMCGYIAEQEQEQYCRAIQSKEKSKKKEEQNEKN